MTKTRSERLPVLDETRRTSFDRVAELYDRARPGYPAKLFDDIAELASLTPSSRLLEIGAGTGKATQSLAPRAQSLLALEPGSRLARVARTKLADFPGVEVVEQKFEDFVLGGRSPFDLVFAAQSFHWVDPAVRCERAAAVLRSGGTLALFWNVPQPGLAQVHERIGIAYADHAPELSTAWAERHSSGRDVAVEVDAAGRFGEVQVREYAWTRSFSAAEWIELLDTQSDHRVLDPAKRARLFDAIGDAIGALGGVLATQWITRAYLAKRR